MLVRGEAGSAEVFWDNRRRMMLLCCGCVNGSLIWLDTAFDGLNGKCTLPMLGCNKTVAATNLSTADSRFQWNAH